MSTTILNKIQGTWMLIRIIAVVTSSIAVILSSLLPLIFNTSISIQDITLMFLFLSCAAVIFHGVLVHSLNDFADYTSGTDLHSPGILSGGSRVIQKGLMKHEMVGAIGKWLLIILVGIALFFLFTGRYELTILIAIGIWAAVSYSLPPLQFSYRPFIGEWLSMFLALFFLGIAGPWLMLETIPLWAFQHAMVNGLVCMGWVMVHHIPDVEADRKATPKKQTSVVWFVEKYGIKYARVPALLYISLAGLLTVWIGMERLLAALIVGGLIIIALYFIAKTDPENVEQVTNCEKTLLIIAVGIAISLGLFI